MDCRRRQDATSITGGGRSQEPRDARSAVLGLGKARKWVSPPEPPEGGAQSSRRVDSSIVKLIVDFRPPKLLESKCVLSH